MPYTIGLASDYYNLQQRLRYFLTGRPVIESEVAGVGNTGDGFLRELIPKSGATAQTVTLTCTGAGPNATFSVVGSVSGSLGTATSTANSDETATYLFVSTQVDLKVIDGPTPWAVNDTYVFNIVANPIPGAQQWTELGSNPGVPESGLPHNWNPVAGTYANEVYLQGPGLSASDEIHVNMCTYYDATSGYYNLGFCGTIGYESLEAWENQPNKSTSVSMAAWQYEIPYWFVADGRRFIISFNISGKYMHGYFGFILPYGTPTEYPYPLYIAGTLNGISASSWSSESHNHRSFYDPAYAYLYTIEGTWLLIQNKVDSSGNEVSTTTSNIWPYESNLVGSVRQSSGDVYPMLPMIVHTSSNGANVYGELSGCLWCPGFANASENTIVIGGDTYVVLQDVFRTTNIDYYALKLA